MRYNKKILFFTWLLFTQSCVAETTYFLCGPDEDGCFQEKDYYRFCVCIPQDPIAFAKPYCLDWDKRACISTEKDDCHHGVTFHTQSECIAAFFQSEPHPPCQLKTRAFCEENHVRICDDT